MEHYLLIALYIFLFFLVQANIWEIIYKQKKYTTLPLLFFYIFADICITLRVVYSIFMYEFDPIFHAINDVCLITKLNVGVLHSWVIFEIALRLKQSTK